MYVCLVDVMLIRDSLLLSNVVLLLRHLCVEHR